MNTLTEPIRLKDAANPAPALRPGKRSRRARVAAGVAVVLAAGGVGAMYLPARHESTDDAYVRVDETAVAPQVRGRVQDLLVRDNEAVKAGQPLLRIDPAEYTARVAQAVAQQQAASAAVRMAEAALLTLDAEEHMALSNSRVVESGIVSALAQSMRAASDEARFMALAETGAVAARDAELSHTTALGAAADAKRVQATLQASRAQEALARSKRPGGQAALAQAQAEFARAQAMLDLARQDEAHTVIPAAVDGTVGALQAHVGDYVEPGSRLLTLVPLQRAYVVAYFKETQTARMVPGQAARIELDAVPGSALVGRVDSLAPGTGSDFALLPFEPGSGNFTKIVQRVPVRIELSAAARSGRLRPGLSATVTVDLAESPRR